MRRILLIVMSLLCAVTLLVAQPVAETPPATTNVAVLAGPTGFSSAGLSNFLDDKSFELSVYPSPNEVIARLANGELDIAALPSNVAANLYNKQVGISIAAVIGDGMLSVLSSDLQIHQPSQLIGKTIHVPGPGSTPDQMAQLLLKEAGLVEGVDVVLDYSVAAPAQLAQMVIAGRVSLAILPEPFVTMIKAQNPRVTVAADVQALYKELTGVANYPMSVLVVRDGFAEKSPRQLAAFLDAYERSISWVLANPKEAGVAIEEAGIMAAAMATGAIPSCNLVWRPAQEAKDALDAYYRFLYAFSPDAIGGAVPGSDLYR
ncbi:MAG: ABC transporter substrate-binding protein [Sphaerochaeta sp.]|jgi:NitT/TauT family transport system substrate-binding protein|nr:ABC transporter substrate-binding protein [Spirochaetales bacterium]